MEYKIIKLTSELSDDYVNQLRERNIQPSETDYDIVVNEPCTVLKPDGSVLLKYLPETLPLEYVEPSWEDFHDVLTPSKNSLRPAIYFSANQGAEGVLGFMDPVYPLPFCRATRLTREHLESFKQSLPMIRAAGQLMATHMPERYDAQMAACEGTHPDYIIPSTPFTTLTLNRDVTATYHTDKGDLKAGIGVIATTWAAKVDGAWKVVSENSAPGGYLVYPKYRVAVNVQTQGLLLCDVHEVHGVTPITGPAGSWARLSYVLYYREHMHKCNSLKEETQRLNNSGVAKGMRDEDIAAL